MLARDGDAGAVAYELDLFTDGERTSASGALSGNLASLLPEGAERQAARLTLADGREIGIELFDLDDGMAAFETVTDLSAAGLSAGWRMASAR